jgi:hypothetical protein
MRCNAKTSKRTNIQVVKVFFYSWPFFEKTLRVKKNLYKQKLTFSIAVLICQHATEQLYRHQPVQQATNQAHHQADCLTT